MNNFQNRNFLTKLYNNCDLIKDRGEFLNKYSNRRFSIRDIAIELLPQMSNLNILDIGYGNGSFIRKLEKTSNKCKFYGLDIVKNTYCVDTKNIKYDIYDGDNFPNYKLKFDVILCMHVLYHIDNFDNFFKQVHSLLNKNGRILITTKSVNTFPKIELIFKKIVNELGILTTADRDEIKFCTENCQEIIKNYFSTDYYDIEFYNLETQVLIKKENLFDLKKYIFSTIRYSMKNIQQSSIYKKYLKMWSKAIDEKFFIDKYIETIILIKKH